MTDDRAGDPDGSADGDGVPTDESEADGFETITRQVLEEISPDERERAHLEAVAEELQTRAETAAKARCPGADVILAGSSARQTWISGDRDIDVFVRFPPSLDRETLETYGLEVGHETVPDGHEEYAEHPYVKGEYEGFDVDVVPCFRLEDATDIRSAVDRTPFHTRYLEARLDDALAADVRLAKQFLKGIGAYGSNLRTEGFSGYLTELLVVEYGGFRPLLEAATDWQPPVELDPEDHGRARFTDSLIVIDPTDPERNVAAVCSPDNVARLQHYAREFLADPRSELFYPDEPDPLSPSEFDDHLARRGATPVAIRFEAPDIVEDQLYPQLEKSLQGVIDGLQSRGFNVLRGTTFAEETGVIFIELAVVERPAVERHRGPPVYVTGHAEGFYEAYADAADVYGPFIDGDRYVVERNRQFTSAVDFLESEALFGVGLGAHVETALEDRYEVLVGSACRDLLTEFGSELRRYFEPVP